LKIGEESSGMTIIKDGVGLNERVVTSNQYRLQPGSHVRVSTAAAASGAAKMLTNAS
jgi:hypothetical protein